MRWPFSLRKSLPSCLYGYFREKGKMMNPLKELPGFGQSMEEKRKNILAGKVNRQRLTLGKYEGRVKERLRTWQEDEFACRLWRKDPTLWFPKAVPEISDRLGWLTLPEAMQEESERLRAFAEEAKTDEIRHGVLLGMGGSSLAPEVFQRTFGNRQGYPELIVLDSTHPAAVKAIEAQVDLRRTLFLVSSKSGTTTEMLSFFRYFWEKVCHVTYQPGRHFVAVTDPGTPLEKLACERDFRSIFKATPDVGGRYSALTFFGLVPAALIGLDVGRLLDRACTMVEASAFCVPEADNPGLALGAALGELALSGRDKLTFVASSSLEAFPAWIEQLVAESTGKEGKGIVPVIDELPRSPEFYGADRLFACLLMEGDDNQGLGEKITALEAAGHPVIHIRLKEKADLAQEFFRWEVAVAAAGVVMGIHPFNQPDVQLAKELASKAMDKKGRGKTAAKNRGEEVAGANHQALRQLLSDWLAKAQAGDYAAVQAYLRPTPETTALLQAVRVALGDRMHLATTLGYGPRFLHSTGQLHKGGPNTCLILQLVDEPADDLAVPETNYTFGSLIHAQALGDYQALKQRGRRVLRIRLGEDTSKGLKFVLKALG